VGRGEVVQRRSGEDLTWLRAPNSGPLFGGESPVSLVTSGTQDGILLVRRHLDSLCTGQAAKPLTDDEVEQTAITPKGGALLYAASQCRGITRARCGACRR
jgi:hypothetical protein